MRQPHHCRTVDHRGVCRRRLPWILSVLIIVATLSACDVASSDPPVQIDETANGPAWGDPTLPSPVAPEDGTTTPLFDPHHPDSRANEVRSMVDAAFRDTAGDQAPSSFVLAERTRTCTNTDGGDHACGDWSIRIPLAGDEPNERIDNIDWILVFEHATPRSLGRALGRTVTTADAEQRRDDTHRVRQTLRVHKTPLSDTIVAARRRSYDAALHRSWERLKQDLDEADLSDEPFVDVSIVFFPHVTPVSKHSVNWFDVEHQQDLDARMRDEHNRRLRAAHEQSRARFESLDTCRWLRAHTLSNGAVVRCHPAELRTLLQWRPPSVAGIYRESRDRVGDGETFRSDAASRLGRFLDVSPSQSRTGAVDPFGNDEQAVTVAYPDPQGFFGTLFHPGFDQGIDICGHYFGQTACFALRRIRALRQCGPQGCRDEWDHPHDTDPVKNHGGQVIGALQSILAGQDPDISDDQRRQKRSYGAYDARLRLYYVPQGLSRTRALEDAAEFSPSGTSSRADIWGYSATAGGCSDPRGWSVSWTQALDAAYDRGLLAVQIAGNAVDRWTSRCTVPALASRSDTVVVGGFGHTRQAPIEDWQYDAQPLAWASITDLGATDRCPDVQLPWNSDWCFSSAEGGADIRAAGAVRNRARTVVDLTAPTGRRFSAVHTESGGDVYEQVCCGTSHAGPAVTSAAVSLRDWGYRRGFALYDDPTVLYALLLLSGDYTGEWASRHTSDPINQHAQRPDGHYRRRLGFSRIWGAGRLHLHRLSGRGSTLGDPSAWNIGNLTIDSTDTLWRRLAISPTPDRTREIAAVAAWEEPALAADAGVPAAAIDIELHAAAPDAAGKCRYPPRQPTTKLAADASFDTKKRIALGPEFVADNPDVIGQCLYLKLDPVDLPGGREAAYVMYQTQ